LCGGNLYCKKKNKYKIKASCHEMRDASKRVCYVLMAIFIKPFFQGKEKEIFNSPGTTRIYSWLSRVE
jgi:hypothetical protein